MGGEVKGRGGGPGHRVWSGRRMGKVREAKPSSPGLRNRQQRRDSKPKKSNMKPKNIDEQEIPSKLREIMRSKEEMKRKRNKGRQKQSLSLLQLMYSSFIILIQSSAKPKRKSPLGASDPHGDMPVPKFKRKKGESVKNYIQRMEQETKHVMFMSKHQLPRYPEMEDKEKGKESYVKSKSEKKKESDKKRLRRLIGKKIERKKMKQEKECLQFADIVQFGEVAMQPPTLTAKPRKSQATNKPGQRQLLLKSLIADSKCGSERTNVTALDVELPSMSMARQRIMLEERERVIKAYRALKKRKLQTLTQN
ncbi:coiled-coil domain-containing protein 137 [Pristis pectinata]|uniref:coiled-coil domain-containing protein 137 n=1 Tax=Pristis pectinata TaxID=685728 RepID=UPI00223D4DC2|nr:coiled-coil domain-containing protein 137 [Pristis pectinata]